MQELPFQTITQLAALVLTLVAGWFFGLASAPGGRKWRERYQDSELESAGYRDRAEQDLREANRKIRELQADNARLAEAADAPAPAHAPVDHGHSTATVAGAAIAGAAVDAATAHAVHESDDKPVEEAHPAEATTAQEPADAHHH